MIFKRVEERRPYPDHDTSLRQWSELPPRQIRLDELITVKRILDLETLLAEDSTFFGDLFAHVVEWRGELYLEDGLHRALRAALQQRPVIHARVLVLADVPPTPSVPTEPSAEPSAAPLSPVSPVQDTETG